MIIFFLFFLDTRPLFENFLKKMFFSPLKSQKHLEKFSKKEKNWLLHIQPRAMSAARAWCRPPTRNFGCPPTMNPHIRNNHHHKLLMELQGGAKRYPRGGGTPLYMKNFYGLELLKNHFYTKKKKWFFAPAESEKNHFFWKLPLCIICNLFFTSKCFQCWMKCKW